MAGELLDIVDDADCTIGKASRRVVHSTGQIHRSVLFFLLDTDGRIFVNQRTTKKEFYPGYWSIVLGGHVPAGESYTQAVRREAQEEAGVAGEPLYIGSFQKRFDTLDRENVQVFAFRIDLPPRLDVEEIERGEFVALGGLDRYLEEHHFLPETAVVIPMIREFLSTTFRTLAEPSVWLERE